MSIKDFIQRVTMSIKAYLKEALSSKSDLFKLLTKYEKKITVYTKPFNIKLGLLRFEDPPVGKLFLFVLPTVQKTAFHTVGMKFDIDIYFYNSKGKLIFKHSNVQPGKRIVCDIPCKFVAEIPLSRKG
jgi:hypothetical protein